MNRLPVIAGPTASGKTQIAIDVALDIGAQIISADSMLIYKRMNIGTAKPNKQQLSAVKHHMIDLVEPWETYSVSDYENDANGIISGLRESNVVPLLCGGTGFYINAVMNGTFNTPAADKEIRAKLEKRVANGAPLSVLHDELKALDPKTAAKVHQNDSYRIIRALEVYHSTGKTMTYFRELHNDNRCAGPEPLIIVLDIARDTLRTRIAERTKKMLEQGLIEEVKGLMANGCTPELKPMKSIGYLQATKIIKGELDVKEAVEEINNETMALAKRQLTWFKKRNGTKWISPEELPLIKEEIKRFMCL